MVKQGRGFHSLSDGWRVSPLPSPSQMWVFFSDEKVICSHPVWGLWREFGETDRLATGVRVADKQRERQERRRRVDGDGAEGIGQQPRPTDTEVYCGWGLTFIHQAERKMEYTLHM